MIDAPPVTGWFRMPRVWPVIARTLKTFAEPVTVWSGACATGEEPYSAAILLRELRISGRVLASDVNDAHLTTAERGWYADLEGVPVAQQRVHFRAADGGYRVRHHVRAGVEFSRRELGDEDIPECHVALVRNVWRYLNGRQQERLAVQLREALAPGGILILGGADLLTADLVPVVPRGLLNHFAPTAESAAVFRAVRR
ncbi:CheR family methyltransferase [Streptomyces sp. NPDC095613]|uniref:CheR family methyltransferase n=1 Tax=Streptomyces sp. NPDC095613 TaxID=3155540 RepID=UPI0033340365